MYAIYGNITINIPQMLAYIQAPWILWVILQFYFLGGYSNSRSTIKRWDVGTNSVFFLGGLLCSRLTNKCPSQEIWYHYHHLARPKHLESHTLPVTYRHKWHNYGKPLLFVARKWSYIHGGCSISSCYHLARFYWRMQFKRPKSCLDQNLHVDLHAIAVSRKVMPKSCLSLETPSNHVWIRNKFGCSPSLSLTNH